MINLVSDTVTKPTAPMLEAMFSAAVGDDVFREDPTVNALEEKAAAMFGMEAALFCPSGTMTNQLAIKMHTSPLDEVICDHTSHIYRAEVGGYAFHSGIAAQTIIGNNGKITAAAIDAVVKPAYDWLPKSALVVLENTTNLAGGDYYFVDEINEIRNVCNEKNMKLHLDGARLFNALVETNDTPEAYGKVFDSISICLSKGLGAPVGSLLLGKKEDILRARRLRKAFGGGMRQAGFLAAAGIYALDNHIVRLKDDHKRASQIGEALAQNDNITSIRPVKTNIIVFDVKAPHTANSFLHYLSHHNIKASAFGPQTVRFVTHLDFTDAMLGEVITAIRHYK
jgi:threonine aldolase